MSEERKNIGHSTGNSRGKITSKQIIAWIGILLLAALYVVTLLAAIFDNSASGSLFAACLYATVAVPLLIWIYTWLYQKVREQKKGATLPEPENTDTDHVKPDK